MRNNIFLTVKEAARFLGISTSTVYRMQKKGLLSSLRTPQGQYYFSKESLINYLKESQDFERSKSFNRYKNQKIDSMVREPDTMYDVVNKKIKSDELFFYTDSIWIYNCDILIAVQNNLNS